MRSFWMAGFEGADHVNRHGEPLDMVSITGHADRIDDDFARLAEHGLLVVRESIGWRLAEPAGDGRFDFSRAIAIARAAERHGIEVLWTLMHYGVPPGASLLDDAIIERFAAFAEAAAKALARYGTEPPVYTPINEISYLAWAACESNFIHPHVGERGDPRWRPMPDGFDVKKRLVRASLAAAARIRAVEPAARFLHIDPLVHVVPPAGADAALADEALRFREFQWQAWDMLAGRLCPELGGSEAGLELIGVNHYAPGQWEFASGDTLAWPAADRRRLPFRALLGEAWQRYRKPLVVAETGHYGPLRATWLAEIAREIEAAARDGIPIEGACLYPIVDRPDWNDTTDWHRSGLWDAVADADADDDPLRPAGSIAPGRHIDTAMATALAHARRRLPLRSVADPIHPTMNTALVVFSHLRWDFVYQRPQHLLSRLAGKRRVVFIEEPAPHDPAGVATPYFEVRPGAPGVEVLRPHTGLGSAGFADDQLARIGAMLPAALAQRRIDDYAVWFYTPLALPLLDAMRSPAPRAVIFDCMDELSAFRFAPRELLEREAALLDRADLVLTGGPSLYEAKRDRNGNVHCVPSSVDARHFSPRPLSADDPQGQRARALQETIAEPRLGYFGVIDERMDLALIERLADAEPSWHLVMVGPVVKVDPAALPQRPNLHWLGMQPYEVLPRLVEAWQVCLMPFALNESTRFISPTKTLEYLAAGKPVVSTAVKDVGVLYGELVRIAAGAEAFVSACRDALAETADERHARALASAALLARSSWDETAARVERTIADALGAAEAPARDVRPEAAAAVTAATAFTAFTTVAAAAAVAAVAARLANDL